MQIESQSCGEKFRLRRKSTSNFSSNSFNAGLAIFKNFNPDSLKKFSIALYANMTMQIF